MLAYAFRMTWSLWCLLCAGPLSAAEPGAIRDAVRKTTLRAPMPSFYVPPPAYNHGTTKEADVMARDSHLWRRLKGDQEAVEGRVDGDLKRYTLKLPKQDKSNGYPITVKPRDMRETARNNARAVDIRARDSRVDPAAFMRVPMGAKKSEFSDKFVQSGRDALKYLDTKPQLPGESLEEWQKRIGRVVKRESRKPLPFGEYRVNVLDFQ